MRRKVTIGIFGRVFLLTLLIAMAFTGSLFYASVRLFTDTLKNQRVKDMKSIIERVADILELKARNLRQLTTIASQISAFHGRADHEITEALCQFANESAGIDVRIAYFVREDGKVFSNAQLYYDIISKQNSYAMPLRIAERTPGSSIIVSEPYYSSIQTARTVAFSRAVLDANGQRLGVVVLELGLNELMNDLLASYDLNTMYVAVLSAENREVLVDTRASDNPAIWGPYRYNTKHFVELLSGMDMGWNTVTESGKWFQIYKQWARGVRWYLLAIMDESTLYQSVPELVGKLLVVCLCFFAALAALLASITRSITRPIRRLAGQMASIRSEAETVPIYEPIRRGDEIGDLSISFSTMLERIRLLIDHQRCLERQRLDMELKVLQSQVSPHFLYNALNAIASLAQQGDTKAIPRSTAALIRLLATSMDKTSEFITLGDELQVLREYLEIQRMRYGDRVEVTIYAPEEMKSWSVPKLILQPLVENAIFHGFPSESEGNMIIVDARENEHELILTISDNGVGMDEEKAGRLLNGEEEDAQRNTRDRLHSIGIAHVHARIRLHYGEQYGLHITSQESVGTKVVAILPKQRRG